MDNQEIIKYRHPAEYLKIIFRRRWLFIVPVFIGLVLSIVACFLLPPTYQSSTVILVEEEKVINPIIQGLAVSTSTAERMRTIKEQILSWNSLVELAKKLALDKNADSQLKFERLIFNLRDNILVQLRGPNFIKLAYNGKNPQETLTVAKSLTGILIEQNLRSQTKETDVAINFIKEQLDVYKKKIKESEIADMEEGLKKLLIDSTEQHPMVKELREKMAAARKELESGEYKVAIPGQPIASPVQEVLKKEIDKMIDKEKASGSGSMAYAANGSESEDAKDPNSAIYKLMVMDKLDTSLARDMRVNENIYNMLLQKLETAKITQRLETSKEGTRYTIIDPPRLPLKPIKPNKILVVFLGVFMGSFSGVGLIFGKEFMDQSFLDIEDAKQHLELPVLGAISRLTTQEEIDKERLIRQKLITVGLFSSLALIVVSFLISLLKK